MRRITYEPTRFLYRSHVFFIQYHFSCSVFAHCPHHLRFSLMTTLHVEFHPSDPHSSKKRTVSGKNHFVSRIVFVQTSQLISLMTAIHVKLHPSNPTFCMVLRNGLMVRRITYEPNRVLANVTINITHDCPPCGISSVKSE